MMAGKITAPYLISSIILVQRTKRGGYAEYHVRLLHPLMLFFPVIMGSTHHYVAFLRAVFRANMLQYVSTLYLEKHFLLNATYKNAN